MRPSNTAACAFFLETPCTSTELTFPRNQHLPLSIFSLWLLCHPSPTSTLLSVSAAPLSSRRNPLLCLTITIGGPILGVTLSSSTALSLSQWSSKTLCLMVARCHSRHWPNGFGHCGRCLQTRISPCRRMDPGLRCASKRLQGSRRHLCVAPGLGA